jgi:hypothetical protein
MKSLDLLEGLQLLPLLAATVCAGLVLAWTVIGLVRLAVRLSGFDPAKSLPIHDNITITSILFALMVGFSSAGLWNDWVQARSAVQREALALQNVLTLADGLSPDRAAKVKAGVITYAKAAVEQEWPAMSREIDMDDPLYAVSDSALVSLIADLSHEAVTPGSSPVSAMLLPQIFEARGARLARLTLASAGLSGVQWFALVSLFAMILTVVALVYNGHAGTQMLGVNLCAVAVSAAFFVLLAHDRPFKGVISVSPTPLLQLIAKTGAGKQPDGR